MTIYFQIIKVDDNGRQYFQGRRAWNFFGWIVSPAGFERWVPNSDSYLTAFHDSAKNFSTLEAAHEAAQHSANYILKESRRKKAVYTVIDTVKITEIK